MTETPVAAATTWEDRPAAPPRGGLLRNIVHLGMGQAATTVLAILLSAVAARTLGAAEFGLLYVVTTIATFAYVFVDWGHLPYGTREIAQHPERAGDLTGTIIVVRAATALVVCVPVVATTWLLGYDRSIVALSVIMILAWIPGYTAMSYSSAFRGSERMDYDALMSVVMKFCTLVLSVVVLALGGRVLGLILISIVNGLITLGVAVHLYRRLQLPRLHVSMTTAWEVLLGGASMLAFGIGVAVHPYINASVLNALSPREVIGWYGATWTIGGTLVAPAVILGTGVYPRFSKVADDLPEFRRVFRTAFRPLALIAVLGGVGTYLFANVAINVVYGQRQFGEAANILRAFAPVLLLLYVDMFVGAALMAMGKAGQLAVTKTIAVIVAGSASYVLAALFQSRYGNGGIGVMLGMAIGELVMVTMVVMLIRRLVDWHLFFDIARALLAGILTMGLVSLLPALTPFVTIPACIVVFVASAAALGLVTREDIASLKTTFRARGAAA